MIDFKKTVERTFKGLHLFSLKFCINSPWRFKKKNNKIIVKTNIQDIRQELNLKIFPSQSDTK